MKRLFLSLMLSFSAAAFAADFQGLGSGSIANDISADGTVVVGSGRWIQAGGWQDIGGTANACNADGSVVVGYREKTFWFGSTGYGYISAMYWTAEGGLIELDSSIFENMIAMDVSDDGQKIVGYVSNSGVMGGLVIPNYREAFFYDIHKGRTLLGDLADGSSCRSAAYAISGNGNLVVGNARVSLSTPKAMYWTESTGVIGMGVLNGTDQYSCITGISQDGSWMIGQSGHLTKSDSDAFYWTSENGMQTLGELENYDYASCPLAMTDDLSTIVGWATDGYDDYAAFLWTESLGMVNLQEYLQDTYGCDLSGWTLTEATGISADGLTITGNGINPDGQDEAWLVTLPEPSSILLLSVGIYWIRKQK